MKNVAPDDLEPDIAPLPTAPPQPDQSRRTGICLVVTKADQRLINFVDKQELPPDEKWMIGNSPIDLSNDWIVVKDQELLDQSQCEWIVFLDSASGRSENFVSKLNALLAKGSLSSGYRTDSPRAIRRDALSQLRFSNRTGDWISNIDWLRKMGWSELNERPARETVGIALTLIGRLMPWKKIYKWLLESGELPKNIELSIVDNSDNPSFSKTLTEDLKQLEASHRFSKITLNHGWGPVKKGGRISVARGQNVATHTNIAISELKSDFIFLLDDDVIPAPKTLTSLIQAHHSLRNLKPGLITAAYESANAKGKIVAARSMIAWEDTPARSDLKPDAPTRMGYVGTGCSLISRANLQACLPLRATLSQRGRPGGMDHWLCEHLRQLGFSIWVHAGIPCEHLFNLDNFSEAQSKIDQFSPRELTK